MSETPLIISNLNDFIFCPVSIYFHSLDNENGILNKDSYQLNGTDAHKNSDFATYSTKRSMLQEIGVYCEKYNIVGKIDTFDTKTGMLTERKKKITQIYDGYVFQLYAQYFSLTEMGYTVSKLNLYSMDDNKVYNVILPEKDVDMFEKFENLISEINAFSFDDFIQDNVFKCRKCIYEPLCSYSCLKGEKGEV